MAVIFFETPFHVRRTLWDVDLLRILENFFWEAAAVKSVKGFAVSCRQYLLPFCHQPLLPSHCQPLSQSTSVGLSLILRPIPFHVAHRAHRQHFIGWSSTFSKYSRSHTVASSIGLVNYTYCGLTIPLTICQSYICGNTRKPMPRVSPHQFMLQ